MIKVGCTYTTLANQPVKIVSDSFGFYYGDNGETYSADGSAQINSINSIKKDPNPKQEYGDKKIPLHLVPSSALICMAVGLAEGKEKYGAWNWRETEVELMTYVGGLKRHLEALVEGEWDDPDGNGKSHLDGLAANTAIICDIMTSGNFIDNRPPVKNETSLERLKVGSRNDN